MVSDQLCQCHYGSKKKNCINLREIVKKIFEKNENSMWKNSKKIQLGLKWSQAKRSNRKSLICFYVTSRENSCFSKHQTSDEKISDRDILHDLLQTVKKNCEENVKMCMKNKKVQKISGKKCHKKMMQF